ncbi:MAG: recombinase family protein [Candidatus Levybacteria bacterium]|nr:recombinase family protein [Candidatus Levybacteria bacterium]
MKALIYCRVSSQRQVDEGNGLSSQEQRCRGYCKNKNYIVEKVFSDGAVSGKLFERPAMRELLNYVDNHPSEKYAVVFDDLSRFSRDMEAQLRLRTEFNARELKRECLNFTFDETPESEYAELVLTAGNQYQRQSNRRQVIQKQKARLEKGYWAFYPPLGLSAVADPLHGKLLQSIEPYATIIKKALESYADGLLSTQEDVQAYILGKYRELGINKKLSMNGTQHILKQILYAGYIEYPKWGVERRKAQHNGFISIETFEKVQLRIKAKGKKWTRHDYSQDFPLRTHLICTHCNKPLTASWNTGRHKRKYPNYFCINKVCIYKNKVIGRNNMESQFVELLNKVQLDNEVLEVARIVLSDMWNSRKSNYEEMKRLSHRRISEVEKKVSSLLERITKTTSDELVSIYEGEIEKHTKEIKDIKKELLVNPYADERFGTAIDNLFATLKNPIDMWKNDNVNNKKAVLFAYFGGKVEYDYIKGFGNASLAYPISLIGGIGSKKNSGVEMGGNEPPSKNHI